MADRELTEQGETYSATFDWRPDVGPAHGHWLFVAVPLWAIMIVGWIPFAFYVIRSMGRHSRRTVHPTCHCGYDLTGNVSGTCPECGSTGQRAASELAPPRAKGPGQRLH